jgi:RNA polymerase sigma-70 factor (ECF subfamily)
MRGGLHLMKEGEKNIKAEDISYIEKMCADTWKSLYRFIYFKVQNREEAEDITQETYCKAILYMKKSNVRIDKSMGFLKTVSLNILRDRWRKSKRQGKTVNFDDINPEMTAIEDYTENIAQREIIQNALKILNKDQRTVIELRILKGCSVADTARLMNKKGSTIRVMQYRALQALNKIIKEKH